jgi:hypothetical protein
MLDIYKVFEPLVCCLKANLGHPNAITVMIETLEAAHDGFDDDNTHGQGLCRGGGRGPLSGGGSHHCIPISCSLIFNCSTPLQLNVVCYVWGILQYDLLRCCTTRRKSRMGGSGHQPQWRWNGGGCRKENGWGPKINSRINSKCITTIFCSYSSPSTPFRLW